MGRTTNPTLQAVQKNGPLRKTASAGAASLIRIKVVLEGISPAIWRRIELPSDTTLKDCHQIIQSVMGWRNESAHRFVKDTKKISPNGRINGTGKDALPAYRDACIGDLLLEPGDSFSYEYDSGEGWEHIIICEKVQPHAKGVIYPKCIGGARSCPPERCGGKVGYFFLLEVVKNSNHPEHENMLNRFGAFDPDQFDRRDINERLKEENFGCFERE
ncbi:MAG TPA: plasmid pRiA4b ORF-3 family protein [Spirochaetota bacterium]